MDSSCHHNDDIPSEQEAAQEGGNERNDSREEVDLTQQPNDGMTSELNAAEKEDGKGKTQEEISIHSVMLAIKKLQEQFAELTKRKDGKSGDQEQNQLRNEEETRGETGVGAIQRGHALETQGVHQGEYGSPTQTRRSEVDQRVSYLPSPSTSAHLVPENPVGNREWTSISRVGTTQRECPLGPQNDHQGECESRALIQRSGIDQHSLHSPAPSTSTLLISETPVGNKERTSTNEQYRTTMDQRTTTMIQPIGEGPGQMQGKTSKDTQPRQEGQQEIIGTSPISHPTKDTALLTAAQPFLLAMQPMTAGIQDLVATMRLPTPKLPIFKGRSRNEYWDFIRAFNQYIGRTAVPKEYKLQALMEACDGPVKNTLTSCNEMAPEEGFERALKILEDRYGNKRLHAGEMVAALLSEPSIREGDEEGLQKLADKLGSCIWKLEAINMLQELDTMNSVEILSEKLPGIAYRRYEDAFFSHGGARGDPPGIKFLKAFMEEEANRMNIRARHKKRTKNVATMNTGPSTNRRAVGMISVDNTRQDRRNPGCPLCSGTHGLTGCQTFRKMTVEGRRDAVARHYLCYVCLNSSHLSKDCRATKWCDIDGCNGKHSRWLHPVNKTHGGGRTHDTNFGRSRRDPHDAREAEKFREPEHHRGIKREGDGQRREVREHYGWNANQGYNEQHSDDRREVKNHYRRDTEQGYNNQHADGVDFIVLDKGEGNKRAKLEKYKERNQ